MAKLQAILTGKETTLNGQKISTLTSSGNVQLEQKGENINIKSSEDVDNAIKWRTNPNLLDNWYFAKPINQRGITHQTQSGYFIDRWRAEYYNVPSADITLVDGGLALQQGSIVMQPLEDGIINAGEIVTASVLYDNTLLSGTIEWSSTYMFICGDNLISANNDVGKRLQIHCNGDFAGHILKALKLEKGSQQTLAHMDSSGIWVLNEIPNFNIEFIKCQRYYRKTDACQIPGRMYTDTNGVFLVPGIHMRAIPTCTITNSSGVSITDAGGKDIKASTVSAIRADSSGVTLSVKNATPAAQVGPATIADFYATFSADL